MSIEQRLRLEEQPVLTNKCLKYWTNIPSVMERATPPRAPPASTARPTPTQGIND